MPPANRGLGIGQQGITAIGPQQNEPIIGQQGITTLPQQSMEANPHNPATDKPFRQQQFGRTLRSARGFRATRSVGRGAGRR